MQLWKNPAIDINDFDSKIREFGMFGKIAITEINST